MNNTAYNATHGLEYVRAYNHNDTRMFEAHAKRKEDEKEREKKRKPYSLQRKSIGIYRKKSENSVTEASGRGLL